MAVVPTGAIYKSLFFDGENSRDYGVYITGQAVYNAPEREVEMVSIPGRNGALALDRGRFENIEVIYPAGIYADNEADFAEAISNFRNLLCSRRGYVRLQDEYNPNEYRLAIYKSGLEVEPTMLRAGEFEIIFDCKPQRYLTSGEEPITIGEWRDTETVTGDIVEVENPDGDLGVKSLSVDLQPIQSLNGYDKPWSGGNGKNKASVNELMGIGWATSNADLLASINSLASGTYTFSFDLKITSATKTGEWQYGFVAINANGNTQRYESVSTDPAVNYTNSLTHTFTISSAQVGAYTAFYVYGCGSNGQGKMGEATLSKIQLESGSTKTAFEPYSNICPIYGRTECDTYVSPTTSETDAEVYTTTLGRTVYGADVEVVGGQLTDKMKMAESFSGGSWTMETTENGNVFSRNAITDKALNYNFICNKYKNAGTYRSNLVNGEIGCYNNTNARNRFSICDNRFSTVADFVASLEDIQVVYELATPQTFQLTETEVELLQGANNVWSDGGSITLEYGQLPNIVINPTLFESSPLIVVEGEGNFSINDYEITVSANEPIGTIQLASGGYISNLDPIRFSTDALNTGDEIYVADVYVDFSIRDDGGATVESYTETPNGYITVESSIVDGWLEGRISYGRQTFVLGSPRNINSRVNHHVVFSNGDTADFVTRVIYKYDGANSIVLYPDFEWTTTSTRLDLTEGASGRYGNVTAYSTILSGGTTIIDCEIGEAYKYEDGTLIPLNSFVSLGSDLPTLEPGANTITSDDTITDLKVTPRWWKI